MKAKPKKPKQVYQNDTIYLERARQLYQMSDGAIVVTNPRDITDHSLLTWDESWWQDLQRYLITVQWYEEHDK